MRNDGGYLTIRRKIYIPRLNRCRYKVLPWTLWLYYVVGKLSHVGNAFCMFVFVFTLRKPQQIFTLYIIDKICTLYINIKCSIIPLFKLKANKLCPFIPDFINCFLGVWLFLFSLGILHKQWLLGFINKRKFNHRRP